MAYAYKPDAEATPEWSPTGFGNKLYREEYYGENAYDKDVDRYRAKGVQDTGSAVTLDQRQANEARGLQMGSLAQLENAARGNAPSQAAMVGQGLTSQALGAGMAAGGAARGGPGAQVAGMRAAMTGAGQQMQQQNAQVMAMRNKEAATDMGSLASMSAAVRGQDIDAASTNAQLEAQRRALDEARQQNYERLGFDTRRTQEGAMTESLRQAQEAEQRRRANADAKQAADIQGVADVLSLGTGMGSSAAAAAARSEAADEKKKGRP